MTIKNILKAGSAALVLTGLLAAPMAQAQTKNVPGANSKIPQRVMTIEVGDGEQINLPVGLATSSFPTLASQMSTSVARNRFTSSARQQVNRRYTPPMLQVERYTPFK